MNKKYHDFIEKKILTQEDVLEIEQDRQKKLLDHANKINEKNKEKLRSGAELKHVFGRVIIAIDLEGKNTHTFSSGQKIYIGRQFNNLNRRETEPVNAVAISGNNIIPNSEILIHPNGVHDSNKIFDYVDDDTTVKYYSIREEDCFLWKNKNDEWLPIKNYATGLRVFEPYEGFLVDIDPKQIKNTLYITSGELKGKVVQTLPASDYEVIFIGSDGREQRIIRCRHYEGEINEREEIVGVNEKLTKLVQNNKYLVGISKKDCNYLNFTKLKK
jgi:hypothetical protein